MLIDVRSQGFEPFIWHFPSTIEDIPILNALSVKKDFGQWVRFTKFEFELVQQVRME